MQNWIDARYELPDKEKYDWVLVCPMINDEHFAVPDVAEYMQDGKWRNRAGEIFEDDLIGVKVAFWMPLPDFPALASV